MRRMKQIKLAAVIPESQLLDKAREYGLDAKLTEKVMAFKTVKVEAWLDTQTGDISGVKIA